MTQFYIGLTSGIFSIFEGHYFAIKVLVLNNISRKDIKKEKL